jgi:predicted  nucleic acid-binding Zn-ribbon protein
MTDFQLLRKLRPGAEKAIVPQQQPPTPRLSERFAHSVQLVESLEQELQATTSHLQDTTNRAKIAEEQLRKTEDALRSMQGERDYFQRRFLETNAKLRSAASIVLDCIRESEKDVGQQEVEAYKPKSKSERAVAKALAGEEEKAKPLPEFLQKGPEGEEPAS